MAIFFNIFKKLPVQYRDIKLENKNIYFEDNNYMYFLFVWDFKKKGNISPLFRKR